MGDTGEPGRLDRWELVIDGDRTGEGSSDMDEAGTDSMFAGFRVYGLIGDCDDSELTERLEERRLDNRRHLV